MSGVTWLALVDPTRDTRQRPDDVVGALALIPRMTVADIGVPQGEVLASELDPDLIRYREARR